MRGEGGGEKTGYTNFPGEVIMEGKDRDGADRRMEMDAYGFISGSLEIKFLILYIMARVVEPVPFETVQELAMCDGGVDYFGFSASLADLVRTEHLTLREGRYEITDKGRRNSAVCESSLPYTVRMEAEERLAECNEAIRRRELVQASVRPREKGGFEVALAFRDELDELMDLKILVTRREMAEKLEKRFREDAEGIYTEILKVLYGKE